MSVRDWVLGWFSLGALFGLLTYLRMRPDDVSAAVMFGVCVFASGVVGTFLGYGLEGSANRVGRLEEIEVTSWIRGLLNLGPSLSLEERNTRLEEKVAAEVESAEFLEKKAELRRRLVTARRRRKEARQSMSVWKPRTFMWVLIASVAALILFATFKGC